MNDETRHVILDKTLSIFLTADFDVLRARLGRCQGRPMFQDKDPDETLRLLMQDRYPIYKQANITVNSYDEPLQETRNRVIETLYSRLSQG